MGRKRAKKVKDILSVSIEHNWVVEKSFKKIWKKSAEIISRHKLQEAMW